jgi:hypothetical protein
MRAKKGKKKIYFLQLFGKSVPIQYYTRPLAVSLDSFSLSCFISKNRKEMGVLFYLNDLRLFHPFFFIPISFIDSFIITAPEFSKRVLFYLVFSPGLGGGGGAGGRVKRTHTTHRDRFPPTD